VAKYALDGCARILTWIRTGDKEGASRCPGEDGIVEEPLLPTFRGRGDELLVSNKAKLV
jgi:hypothetical protein